MNFKTFICVILISCCFVPRVANACALSSGKPLIQRADVIFKGIITKSKKTFQFLKTRKPNAYSSFKVTEKYKGVIGDQIDIYYMISPNTSESFHKTLPEGKEYLMFAYRSKDGDYYTTGFCTPRIDIDQLKKYPNRGAVNTLEELELFQSQKQALDKLIAEYGSEDFYLKKAQLLENYNDWEQARLLYEGLIKKAYETDKQAVIDAYKKYPSGVAYGIKNRYKVENDVCTGDYAVQQDTPDFLKNFPAPAPSGNYLNDRKYLLAYGRTLFHLGDYQAALRPLCLVGQDKEAESLKIQALMKLGKTTEIDKHSIKLVGVTLDDIDLSGLDIERSDFSSSTFRNLKINNTNLIGTNFSSAKLQRTQANGANLSGANFSKVDASGDFSYSNLSYANVSDSFFQGNFTGANLEKADFSNSKVSADLSGADLKDANFKGAYIYKLAGAKLENTNLDGIQSRFGRFPGSQSNYSNTDLSGFDFTGSDFSETNFTGVIFKGSNLSHANLKGSNFQGVDFSSANLEEADFSSYRNHPTDLRKANLGTAIIKNTSFSAALYDCDTKFPEGFNPATYLMENAEGSCGKAKAVPLEGSLGIETILQPPSKHWRLMNFADLQTVKSRIHLTNKLKCKWLSWTHTGNIRPQKMTNEDLSGRDFSGCMLGYADFSGSKLNGANFKGAYLYGANFETADLQGANFNGARIANSTKLPSSFDASRFKFVPTSVLNAGESPWQASYKFEERNLTSAYHAPKYSVPDFPGENLDEINYTAAWLPGSNMEGASLRLTNFTASNLMGANFKKADLTGAVLYNALLDNADFTSSKLYGADLRWARLTGAKLDDADLTNAIYDNTTIWPQGFDPQKAGAFLIGPKEKPSDLPNLPEGSTFKNLPAGTVAYALGVYEGRNEDGGQYGHGSNRQCTINVTVQKTDSPLFLVLSSYEPAT